MSSRAGLRRLVLALIASLIYAPGLRAGAKGLSWQADRGVIWESPWAQVRLDLNPEQQGPLLRFLNDGRQVRLEKPTVQSRVPRTRGCGTNWLYPASANSP
jgi:hypothetical protein